VKFRLVNLLNGTVLAVSAHVQLEDPWVICRNTVWQELCEVQADTKDQERSMLLLVLVQLRIPEVRTNAMPPFIAEVTVSKVGVTILAGSIIGSWQTVFAVLRGKFGLQEICVS